MRAFHSTWSAPFFRHNPSIEFTVAPFELLTTVLSAVFWQKYNGSLAMLCDSTAAAFYRACGLDGLWHDGIQPVLDDMPREIDPHIFWAAGKLFALRQFGAPCAMLDTDFIVWKALPPLTAPVTVIHREDIVPAIYPDAHAFSAARGFDFSAFDWTVKPANTALSCFLDPDFTRLYADTALSFMRSAAGADNPLTYMVFAEQRLLPMLAAQQRVPLAAFSDLPALFASGQTYFTHIWGFKQQMQQNPALLDAFCRRCAVRLLQDAPQWTSVLMRLPAVSGYFVTKS